MDLNLSENSLNGYSDGNQSPSENKQAKVYIQLWLLSTQRLARPWLSTIVTCYITRDPTIQGHKTITALIGKLLTASKVLSRGQGIGVVYPPPP